MILTKLIQIINDVEAVAVNTFQNILMVRFLIIRHDVNMVTNGEMHCGMCPVQTLKADMKKPPVQTWRPGCIVSYHVTL